jgi:hypothetical protein
MKTVVPDLSLNEECLFDEFSCVQKYCESKLEVWNEKMTKMLAHFTEENINAVSIKCLISFCLAVPGSYATIEGVFSIINALMSDGKTDLKQKP